MMQHIIDVCELSDRHNYNGLTMVFSTLPKKPKERVCRGKDGETNNKKNSIKLCQNEAWASLIKYGCENGCVDCSNNVRFKTFLHHLHPSVITFDPNYRHRLKIRASPKMCLSQYAVENDLHKENINLPRFVGLPEDLQHVHNYEMKI